MKPQPIILIHGLGGRPEDWKTTGFLDFLLHEGGYDPDLIRLFDYGHVKVHGVPKYNYQGDLTQIAHRLADDPQLVDAYPYQVDRLSQESVERGGPEKVDLIAYSLGGLVARYYLACQQEDHWGTVYKGKVGRLIEIGVPNLGSHWVTLYEQVLKGSLLWRAILLLTRFHLLPLDLATDVQAIQTMLARLDQQTVSVLGQEHNQPISLDSPAAQQLRPTSPFMRWLNRPEKTPPDVRYYCLCGDIILDLEINLFGVRWRRTWSFGDLAITVSNATTIAGVRPTIRRYEQRYGFLLGELAPRTAVQAEALVEPPPYSHVRLNDQPTVQTDVLRILQSRET